MDEKNRNNLLNMQLYIDYIKAIENPDKIGWNGKVWIAPQYKGYDKNQRGYGIDIIKNDSARRLTQNRPGQWLTEEEADKLMKEHLLYIYGAALKHIEGFDNLSDRRKAVLLGMLYRGDSVNKNRHIIDINEPDDNKFFESINNYYKSKGLNERAKNSSNFFNNQTNFLIPMKWEQWEPPMKFKSGGQVRKMQTAAGGPLFPWLKLDEEWVNNWKFRTTPAARSKVLSGKGVETDKQYTERRKKETTKRTWRSDAADFAHSTWETALAFHPYTAIPYYGALVGQDFLNGNYSWQTALKASIPLFHLSPQAVGLREATNVALEDAANAGSKTARNWRVAREINTKNTKNLPKEYSPVTRTRIGDVEINDPQMFYRQGPIEMGNDFLATGIVNPGTEYVNPMFARGRLFYGLGDAMKTKSTLPVKETGRFLLSKLRVDKPKPDLITTKVKMSPANLKSYPIKEIIEKDRTHPFSERDYKTYSGMEGFMNKYNDAYYNGEIPDFSQVKRVTHELTRTVPKELVNSSNATLYRYLQGYGYKKVLLEPRTSLAFFERKPSKISEAEKFGLNKHDRKALSINELLALEDLALYKNSGLYRLVFRVTPDWENFGWNLDRSNPSFLWLFAKDGKSMRGPWARVVLQTPTGKGVLAVNPERNMAGYTSRSFPVPEGMNWAPGEANMMIDGTNGLKIILTAPRTDFFDAIVEKGSESIGEGLPNTIDKNIMKNFWINSRKAQRPGTYLSGDNGHAPKGSELIEAFKKKQLHKVDIKERPLNKLFVTRTGLSPDSYSSIIRQGNRDGSLRWGEGFNKWNNSAVENRFINEAFLKLQKGEITPEQYEEIFNNWSLNIGGRKLLWKDFNGHKIPIHPHPYIYAKKQGGKMNIIEFLKKGSGIHIKKKNRGKFTEYCGGKVTDECIRKAKASGNPTLVKRATFADNARHFKHKNGGKAFVEGVNVLDSNPKAYKYVKKKYKMRLLGGILDTTSTVINESPIVLLRLNWLLKLTDYKRLLLIKEIEEKERLLLKDLEAANKVNQYTQMGLEFLNNYMLNKATKNSISDNSHLTSNYTVDNFWKGLLSISGGNMFKGGMLNTDAKTFFNNGNKKEAGPTYS